MTAHQIIGLGLRVFCIWLILWITRYIVLIPNNFIANDFNKQAMVSITIGVSYLVVAILVWFFPMTIANKLIPRSNLENKINTNPKEVSVVAISILGLWQLVQTAPALVSYLFQAYLNAGDRSIFATLDVYEKSDVIFMIIELIIAVVLLKYSNKIASFIMKPQGGSGEQTF